MRCVKNTDTADIMVDLMVDTVDMVVTDTVGLEMILVDLAMVGNETLLFIYLFMYLVTINK